MFVGESAVDQPVSPDERGVIKDAFNDEARGVTIFEFDVDAVTDGKWPLLSNGVEYRDSVSTDFSNAFNNAHVDH